MTKTLDIKSLAGTKADRPMTFAAKSVKGDDRRFDFTISTQSLDRQGEVLVARGAKWKNFLAAGGGVTWMHLDHTYPVAKAESIRHEDDALVARVFFPPKPAGLEQDWEPDYMHALVEAEMVKATSVSLMRLPDGVRAASNSDRAKYGDGTEIVTSKWEMLNFSFVNVPANPEALAKAVQKGLVTESAAKRWGGLKAVAPERKRLVVTVPKFGTLDVVEKATRRAIAKRQGLIYLRG